MLLPHIRRVLPLRQWCSCRTLVDAVPKYSPKVRAIPFAISEADALSNMNFFASLTFASFSLQAVLQGSKPKQVQAVYFPAWIVDAEVETNAWLGDSGQQLATVQLVDSYLPGYAYDFLSRISLNNVEMAAAHTVPFSKELAVQHGSQVLCLPYNVSPLSLPKKLRALPNRITVTDNLRFDPAVKFNFLAVYPVLIPLYLANYEAEGISTTVVLEAFAPLGRVYFEWYSNHGIFFHLMPKIANHIHDKYWQFQGTATPFSKVSMSRERGALQKWLDRMISQPGGPEQLVTKGPVDFADRSVREFTGDETDKNREFLRVSNNMAEMMFVLKHFANSESGSSDQGIVFRIGNNFASSLKSEIEKLQKQRDEITPQWWKDRPAKSPLQH